jgi:hypothetical protein
VRQQATALHIDRRSADGFEGKEKLMSFYVVGTRSRRIQAAHERSLRIVEGNASLMGNGKLPKDAEGAYVLLPGESLRCGSRSSIRHRLRTPGVRGMALVHYPAIPQLDLDLIVLQPRLFSAGAAREEIEFGLRIAAPAEPDRELWSALRDYKNAWTILSLGVLEASQNPAAAIDRLRRLWERQDNSPLFRSLVLRNSILLLIRQGDNDRARKLLTIGLEAFPD